MTTDQDQADDLARQEIVNDVLARHEGLDVDGAAAALQQGFAARGLPVPTGRWLESTAIELAAGRKVVVSAATADAARSVDPDQGEDRGQPPAGVPA